MCLQSTGTCILVSDLVSSGYSLNSNVSYLEKIYKLQNNGGEDDDDDDDNEPSLDFNPKCQTLCHALSISISVLQRQR